jgi:hypothetical protein
VLPDVPGLGRPLPRAERPPGPLHDRPVPPDVPGDRTALHPHGRHLPAPRPAIRRTGRRRLHRGLALRRQTPSAPPLGCYLAGFHLLPMLGLSGTNTLAASLNGAIAGVAFLLSRRLGRPEPPAPGRTADRSGPAGRRPLRRRRAHRTLRAPAPDGLDPPALRHARRLHLRAHLHPRRHPPRHRPGEASSSAPSSTAFPIPPAPAAWSLGLLVLSAGRDAASWPIRSPSPSDSPARCAPSDSATPPSASARAPPSS